MTFSEDAPSPYADSSQPIEDNTYPQLLKTIQQHFEAATGTTTPKNQSVTNNKDNNSHLFTTQVPDLFQLFLNNLPPALRQRCTCATCRKFVNQYGNLVTINEKGKTTSAIWPTTEIATPYAKAMSAIATTLSQAPINGVFLTEQTVWGKPEAGGWPHFSLTASEHLLFKSSPVMSTGQVMADKKQDYQLLEAGLTEFPLQLAQKAHRLLSTGSLYRSETCIEIAQWFVNLHQARKAVKSDRAKQNLTWLAVATAPPGFCHIRSTMIGTLLSDLKENLAFAQIKARFDAKMHPLKYQRATALPTAGNIARAEKIFDQLKTAGALERRYAKLEDLQTHWQPATSSSSQAKPGIFSHLASSERPKATSTDIPPVVMTWDKFSRTVLPTAKTIEYFVPASKRSYMALVTAKHPEAPPILQWDTEANRNPVSWYFPTDGVSPTQWNLTPNRYWPVTAIVLQPTMWDKHKKFTHHGEKVFFLLKDSKDLRYTTGAGFFTSFLKRDYYEVRATLEAYAKSAILEASEPSEACGLGLSKGNTWNHRFRVTAEDNLQVIYQLDRWD